MDPQFEYAYHWLRATAVYLQRPFDLALNRQRVTEIDGGRPGFATQLRRVALEALESEEPELVHKAVAALAVVGERSDIPRIRALAEQHKKVAATAIFEIEHGARAV